MKIVVSPCVLSMISVVSLLFLLFRIFCRVGMKSPLLKFMSIELLTEVLSTKVSQNLPPFSPTSEPFFLKIRTKISGEGNTSFLENYIFGVVLVF